jgi:DNA-binding NarL/FixJ family response regulator
VSRIVIVDDHPVFRKGLAALLRSDGHDVVAEASDGVEAIAIVDQERPDLVLMDLAMPIRDGFEATAHITVRHPETRVVVITLFDDEASVVRALQAGASGYVSKQADPDQITGAVDAALRGAMWLGAPPALPPGRRIAARSDPARARHRGPPQPRADQSNDRRAAVLVDQDGRQLRQRGDAQARSGRPR